MVNNDVVEFIGVKMRFIEMLEVDTGSLPVFTYTSVDSCMACLDWDEEDTVPIHYVKVPDNDIIECYILTGAMAHRFYMPHEDVTDDERGDGLLL